MKNIYFKTILLFMLCIASLNAIAQSSDEQLEKYTDKAKTAANDEEFMAAMNSADSFTRKIKDVGAQAQVNEDIAHYFYERDADKCIEYMLKAFRLHTSVNNKKKASICLNNIAFAYEEQKKDIAEAMKYTKRAVIAHTELKDTLAMANMYKYQSMLYGKLHDYDKGKKSAVKAIQLYTAKNDNSGLAVSCYDLASVFEEERQYDSSIALLLKAKEIWKQNGNEASRIYGNNIALLRIYAKVNKMEEAEEMVQQNIALEAGEIHYSEKLKFYKESKDYYTKNKDKETAKIYKEKYSTLQDSLKGEGKNAE